MNGLGRLVHWVRTRPVRVGLMPHPRPLDEVVLTAFALRLRSWAWAAHRRLDDAAGAVTARSMALAVRRCDERTVAAPGWAGVEPVLDPVEPAIPDSYDNRPVDTVAVPALSAVSGTVPDPPVDTWGARP